MTESQAGIDRRASVRKVLIVKKMTLTEIIIGDSGVPRIHYVYINDISETGVRLSSDINFPEGRKIRLKFFLNTPFSIEAQLRWKKPIGINNFVNGLEFVYDSEKGRDGARQLITWAEPYFEKTSIKLNSTLFIETDLEGPGAGIYVLALSISPRRMEVMSSTPLPEDKVFTLTFSLRPECPPLTVQAQVIHRAECPVGDTGHNNFAMWLEFTDSEPVKAHLIDAFAEEPPQL